MVQVLSKLTPIKMTCKEFAHPWTNCCLQAATEYYVCSVANSPKQFALFYLLSSMVTLKFPPTKKQLKTITYRTLLSTFLLSAACFQYSLLICFFRRTLGHFNIWTVSAIPSLIAASTIFLEHPSRKKMLALQSSNLVLETLWNMAVSRNLTQPIKFGQVGLFSASIAVMLYYYKSGAHQCEDSTVFLFKIIRFILGPYEEKNYNHQIEEKNETEPQIHHKKIADFRVIMFFVQKYNYFKDKLKNSGNHQLCPHPFSCIYYILGGAAKMFCVGLIVRICLKGIFNIKHILTAPTSAFRAFLTADTFSWAILLGGFSGIFRGTMCSLRRIFNKDSPYFGFAAGLLAGTSFFAYPSVDVALNVFIKMVQITYNIGIKKGITPELPKFGEFLFCVNVFILFHYQLLEPTLLRADYWKLANGLTGGRVAAMNRKPLDVWGLKSSEKLSEMLRLTKTTAEVKRINWFKYFNV